MARVRESLYGLAFALLGLVVMGSTVTCSSVHYEGQALVDLAQQQSSLEWSKDGSRIVFSRAPSGVFVVEADGSRMWSLPPGSPIGTDVSMGSFSPAISPNGARVAYAIPVTTNYSADIVTSAIDGSDVRRLTDNKALDAYPAWSPDGTEIAFISDRPKPGLHLYIMDPDGSNVRGLVPSVGLSRHAPVWSPDGSRIAFVAVEYDDLNSRRYFAHTVLKPLAVRTVRA